MLPCCVTVFYSLAMDLRYRFKRGDRVAIVWGRHKGATGVVESAVFQRTVDYPDEFATA